MKEFESLVKIMSTLRSKNGCKWDKAQKLKDLKMYLLEETYELIDVIGSKHYKKIEEELGDVFLILVFICQMYTEKNKFRVEDVLKAINSKMVRRHPHVFSPDFKKNNMLKTKDDIVRYWIKEKARNKKRKSIYERLPKKAPSLLLAYMLYKEEKYLGKKSEYKKIISDIKKKMKTLDGENRGNQVIIGIIMDLSRLALLEKLNLELTLRKKVFSEARSMRY